MNRKFDLFVSSIVEAINNGQPYSLNHEVTCSERSPCLDCYSLSCFLQGVVNEKVLLTCKKFKNLTLIKRIKSIDSRLWSNRQECLHKKSLYSHEVISDPITNSILINTYLSKTGVWGVPTLYYAHLCGDRVNKLVEYTNDVLTVAPNMISNIYMLLITNLHFLQEQFRFSFGQLSLNQLLFINRNCEIEYKGMEFTAPFTMKFISFRHASMVVNKVRYHSKKSGYLPVRNMEVAADSYSFLDQRTLRSRCTEAIGFDTYHILTDLMMVERIRNYVLENETLRSAYVQAFGDQFEIYLNRCIEKNSPEEVLLGLRLQNSVSEIFLSHLKKLMIQSE